MAFKFHKIAFSFNNTKFVTVVLNGPQMSIGYTSCRSFLFKNEKFNFEMWKICNFVDNLFVSVDWHAFYVDY